MAGEAGHEVLVCDNLHMPYRNGCCDAVISIGVIHHLTTNRRRAKAIRELARILRPGGRIMIYVWAMEQTKRKVRRELTNKYPQKYNLARQYGNTCFHGI